MDERIKELGRTVRELCRHPPTEEVKGFFDDLGCNTGDVLRRPFYKDTKDVVVAIYGLTLTVPANMPKKDVALGLEKFIKRLEFVDIEWTQFITDRNATVTGKVSIEIDCDFCAPV